MNKVEKPWGHYIDLYRSKEAVVKVLVINPGQSISHQYHKDRSEYWICLAGTGHITINDIFSPFSEHNYAIIPPYAHHSVKNDGNTNLVINEFQYGECSEEDIVRISDPYDR